MKNDLTPGMLKILRASALNPVQVSLFVVYAGLPGFSNCLGAVREKDVLVKEGLLIRDKNRTTHYVITDEGRDILAELSVIVA